MDARPYVLHTGSSSSSSSPHNEELITIVHSSHPTQAPTLGVTGPHPSHTHTHTHTHWRTRTHTHAHTRTHTTHTRTHTHNTQQQQQAGLNASRRVPKALNPTQARPRQLPPRPTQPAPPPPSRPLSSSVSGRWGHVVSSRRWGVAGGRRRVAGRGRWGHVVGRLVGGRSGGRIHRGGHGGQLRLLLAFWLVVIIPAPLGAELQCEVSGCGAL